MAFVLEAGRLNRTVTFERPVDDGDDALSAGEQIWVKVATVRAEIMDARPSRDEALNDGLRGTTRRARMIIRYRRDIDATMRAVFDGRVMQIVGGPAELGFHQALELMVEEFGSA